MTRETLLDFIAGQVANRKRPDRPFNIGIDGRCAAGKSTLADELGSVLGQNGYRILRHSVDGFHHAPERRYRQGEYSSTGYYEDAYDYDTLIEYLLKPVSGDVFPVAVRQVAHDVRANLPVSAPPIAVDENCVLLFDGVFLFRSQLNLYWDFRILLHIDAATSLSRAVERDSGMSSPDVVRRKYELRYEPAWQIYSDQEHPERKADLIIDNRDFLNPQFMNSCVMRGN